MEDGSFATEKPCIIRPHRSTTYIDAAYSYRPSSVVCLSVCLSVTQVSPAKTAAVWVEDLGWPGEPCIRWGSRSPWEGANFWGRMGVPL